METKSKELNSIDQRMLQVLDKMKEAGVIRFNQEFCDTIGVPKTYLDQVRNRGRSFTPDHIARACRAYNLNANWVLGLESSFLFDGSRQRKAFTVKA